MDAVRINSRKIVLQRYADGVTDKRGIRYMVGVNERDTKYTPTMNGSQDFEGSYNAAIKFLDGFMCGAQLQTT